MAARQRLDTLMAERGIVESREKAKALILAGEVIVGGEPVTQPSAKVDPDAEIQIKQRQPYVSRGGIKLAHALDEFGIDVDGLVAVDVGASTGGFTDCLLQRGAARVYAVDVGYGQLDYRLHTDPRVVVLDRTNIRDLEALPELGDIATIDVAFISLEKVLPAVMRLTKEGAIIVALVKPQFEAGRAEVGKKGVVRDPLVHAKVLRKVGASAIELGLKLRELTPSPLLGPEGNREFLMFLAKQGEGRDLESLIAEVTGVKA